MVRPSRSTLFVNLLIALIVPAASIVAIGLVDVRLSMIVEGRRHGGGLEAGC